MVTLEKKENQRKRMEWGGGGGEMKIKTKTEVDGHRIQEPRVLGRVCNTVMMKLRAPPNTKRSKTKSAKKKGARPHSYPVVWPFSLKGNNLPPGRWAPPRLHPPTGPNHPQHLGIWLNPSNTPPSQPNLRWDFNSPAAGKNTKKHKKRARSGKQPDEGTEDGKSKTRYH